MTTATTTTTTTNPTKTTDTRTNAAATAERVGRPESELRAAARKKGLTVKELAALMGVSASHLSQVGTGKKPWTPSLREKAIAILGEVPGQGIVYRQNEEVTGESNFIRETARAMGMTMLELSDRSGVSYSYLTQVAKGRRTMGIKAQASIESVLGTWAKIAPAKLANRQCDVVQGTQSSYIRERARALGMTLKELAEKVGVSLSYMSQVARGHRHMGVKLQAKVEAVLQARVRVESAQCSSIDRQVVWERMDELDVSQNEVARRAGISSGHLSQIMNGQRSPSAVVLRNLHGVLFQRMQGEERVMPADVKVLGWKKGERSGMVVHGTRGRDGTARGGAVRVGGRVPWGAEVEYAYRTGYDGNGRVSVEHVVTPPISAMLMQPQAGAA
ncbi:MAG: helix-turn-helix domain-containing protein [Chloroflexota bacterium]|nr:helix-turn-helix domain-containing protein [Chloroflexota bacterium]